MKPHVFTIKIISHQSSTMIVLADDIHWRSFISLRNGEQRKERREGDEYQACIKLIIVSLEPAEDNPTHSASRPPSSFHHIVSKQHCPPFPLSFIAIVIVLLPLVSRLHNHYDSSLSIRKWRRGRGKRGAEGGGRYGDMAGNGKINRTVSKGIGIEDEVIYHYAK